MNAIVNRDQFFPTFPIWRGAFFNQVFLNANCFVTSVDNSWVENIDPLVEDIVVLGGGDGDVVHLGHVLPVGLEDDIDADIFGLRNLSGRVVDEPRDAVLMLCLCKVNMTSFQLHHEPLDSYGLATLLLAYSCSGKNPYKGRDSWFRMKS